MEITKIKCKPELPEKISWFVAETRQCMICRQIGHIARNCPTKGTPQAALGAPPK